MRNLLLHVCLVSSVSAFVVGGRVFTPNLRGSTVSMASIPKNQKPGLDYDAPYLTKEKKVKGLGPNFQQLWKGQLRFDDKEESRRNKLITGTNWAPRTYPEKGKGYFFFQGPTPKTAYQKDLPSFFSAENFASMKIAPQQIAVTITGFLSFAILAVLLAGPPQGISPPAVNLQMATPDLKQKKDAPTKPAPAKKDPVAEKAAAEKATAEKAAAKKVAAEKAAAEKAAAGKAKEEKAAAEKAAAAKAKEEKAAAEKAAAAKVAAEKAEAAKPPEVREAEAKAAAAKKAAAEKAAAEKAAADAKVAAEKAIADKAAAEKAIKDADPSLRDEPTADELRDIIKRTTKQRKY